MNWDSIIYVLKSFGIKRSERTSFENAENILLLDEYVLDDPDTLYICLDPNMEQRFEKSLIISIGPCKIECKNYVEIEGGSAASVFNALMEPDRNLKTLTELMGSAASDQEIIDIASSFLGTPFFYFDESYRVLAITKNMSPENDPEWEYMTEQKFLSPDSIKMMQENGDLEWLAKTDEAVVYDADFFPFVSIVTNISYEERPYARLNRLCLNGKVTPMMIEECNTIARSLRRMIGMKSSRTYNGPVDNMIRDILNGAQLPEALIRNRITQFKDMEKTCFRLCIIDVKHGSDVHVPSYYLMLTERIFDGMDYMDLIYEDNIVLILQAASEDGFGQATSILEQFLCRQGLRAGMSDVFRKFASVRMNYEQAFAALFFADASELVSFEDIVTDHLISMIPDDRREVFVPYALKKLEEEQSRVTFDLRETLRAYLECNCSLHLAAEKLFLHKNTMLYRVNKIKSVIGEELDDPYKRMMLLLALKLLEKDVT